MTNLTGRVALITGGGRGIGRAIAIGLSQAGAAVAINYLSRRDAAESTQHEIAATGGHAIAVQGDVSKAGDVERVVRSVEQGLGSVDILVNNAGMIRPQPLDEITLQDWDEVIAANLTSAFLCTQAVLPGMRKRHWGRIINIASLAAQTGGLVGPHYSAAKAGMLGLTHCYATLLVKEGITVNAICPALIETDMVRNNPRARPDLVPVGRFGTVEEHAEVAVMLARNGYMTGQTLNVNGGMYFS